MLVVCLAGCIGQVFMYFWPLSVHVTLCISNQISFHYIICELHMPITAPKKPPKNSPVEYQEHITASLVSVPRIGLRSTLTMARIKRLLKMNE